MSIVSVVRQTRIEEKKSLAREASVTNITSRAPFRKHAFDWCVQVHVNVWPMIIVMQMISRAKVFLKSTWGRREGWKVLEKCSGIGTSQDECKCEGMLSYESHSMR